MIVALEGLPGAGKTTTAQLLAESLGADVLKETTQEHPFLETIYDDERRFDLEVELAFLLLHAGAYRRVDRTALTILDYSPYKDTLFAREMLAPVHLDLWMSAYEQMYSGLALPDLVIVLSVSMPECLLRIRRRGRDFEAGLTMERLERLSERYEEQLPHLGQEVVVLPIEDAQDEESVAARVSEIVLQRVVSN